METKPPWLPGYPVDITTNEIDPERIPGSDALSLFLTSPYDAQFKAYIKRAEGCGRRSSVGSSGVWAFPMELLADTVKYVRRTGATVDIDGQLQPWANFGDGTAPGDEHIGQTDVQTQPAEGVVLTATDLAQEDKQTSGSSQQGNLPQGGETPAASSTSQGILQSLQAFLASLPKSAISSLQAGLQQNSGPGALYPSCPEQPSHQLDLAMLQSHQPTRKRMRLLNHTGKAFGYGDIADIDGEEYTKEGLARFAVYEQDEDSLCLIGYIDPWKVHPKRSDQSTGLPTSMNVGTQHSKPPSAHEQQSFQLAGPSTPNPIRQQAAPNGLPSSNNEVRGSQKRKLDLQ